MTPKRVLTFNERTKENTSCHGKLVIAYILVGFQASTTYHFNYISQTINTERGWWLVISATLYKLPPRTRSAHRLVRNFLLLLEGGDVLLQKTINTKYKPLCIVKTSC